MAARNEVAIRLATEGKEGVLNDFTAIAGGSDDVHNRMLRNFERTVRAAEVHNERMQRMADAIRARSAANPTGEAAEPSMASATPIRDAAPSIREADRAAADYQRRAEALLGAIDPAWAAQQRFNRELTEARTLLSAGAISSDQYAKAERVLTSNLNQTIAAQQANARASGLQQAGYQQLGFQVNDVITQMAAGAPITQVFAQQASQMVQAISMIASGGGGGAEEASNAVQDLSGSVNDAKDAFDQNKQAIETVTGVLGLNAAAEEGSAAATGAATATTGAHARAKGQEAVAAGASTRAVGLNAEAHLGNKLATDANTAATLAYLRATLGSKAATDADNASKAASITIGARFAAFMGGPWGAGIIGAITLISLFATSMGEADESTEDMVEAMREQAEQARRTAEAQNEWRDSTEGLQEALQELDRQLGRVIETGYRSELQAFANARSTQAETESRLRNARAMAEERRQAAQNAAQVASGQVYNLETGQAAALDQAALGRANAALAAAEADVQALERQLAEMPERVRLALMPLMRREVASRNDPAAAATNRYEADEVLINEAFSRGDIDPAEFQRRLGAAQRTRDAALEAARARPDRRRRGGSEQSDEQRAIELGREQLRQMQDETALRDRLNERYASQNDGHLHLNNALADESRLLPLIRAQMGLTGAARAQATTLIDGYRTALSKAREEEARSAAILAIGQSGDQSADARRLSAIADAEERAVEAARIAASREGKARGYSDGDRERYIEAEIDRVRAQQDGERLDRFREINREQGDQISMLQMEFALRGRNAGDRARELRFAEQEVEWQRELGPLYAEKVDHLRRQFAWIEGMREELERTAALEAEFNQSAAAVVDTLFDPRNWEDWGDVAEKVIGEVQDMLLRLALLNPLKNWLTGSDLPSMLGGGGGPGGFLGGLLGGSRGGGDLTDLFDDPSFALSQWIGGFDLFGGAFATGTASAPGGMAWVGENGPELVGLPRGSRVHTAAVSRAMTANDNGIGSISIPIRIDATGADPAGLARVQAEVASLRREMPVIITDAVRDYRERTFGRG